jgi:hypothetical protein
VSVFSLQIFDVKRIENGSVKERKKKSFVQLEKEKVLFLYR